MSNRLLLIVVLYLLTLHSTAQTDTSLISAGIWQYTGTALPKDKHPEMNGRLSNFRWADLEPSPNQWNWKEFDSELTAKASDSLPIIFMVYTKEDVPDWIFSKGVPKVTEKDDNGNVTGYSPYYADPDYKKYFKRMITTVSAHIKTLPPNVQSMIIAVQGCYGSTGDYISYKGNVDPQYKLSGDDFFALFKEFSLDYYNEYKTNNPSIHLLSNPPNTGDEQLIWVTQNCPGGWLKNGTLGKAYQLNDEKSKSSWLFPVMNTPQQGGFIRSRSEITGDGINSQWWNKVPYQNMFALMCYAIHWGLDWSNQNADQLNNVLYDSSFRFFNKYAGQKDASKSLHAMCALKDVIDASDVVRFPENIYGHATRTTTRMQSVLTPFITYGAKLEDPYTATLGEYGNLSATGINDVGWDLFPGNYERYLHQVDANTTSAGYWNVQSSDPNSMYGRFARGFDLTNGKDALYFDVEDAFLKNKVLNGSYPVMIEITYLDKGTGSFQIYYDAQGGSNTSSITVTCKNSGQWKKASVTLSDAYFGNRGKNGSDFYIKNTGSENVIFSIAELTRPHANNADVGFSASPLSFDSICVNSASTQPFTVSGLFLNGDRVVVGPLNGFSFSDSADGTYPDSLIIKKYGASFKQNIYVKFNPVQPGNYDGSIPVRGGGADTLNVSVTASALSAATLSADINNISCYGNKDGSINLKVKNAIAPVTCKWSNENNFKASTQDIDSLKPATYTVTVNSAGGCTATASYVVTQPDRLKVSLSADTMICKGGSTNLYITATGGTKPYNGTGTFVEDAGFKSITVTDANGCSDKASINIANGTLNIPAKPTSITGANADATGLCGGGDFNYTVSKVDNATSYLWVAPANCTVSNVNDDASKITLHARSRFDTDTLSVYAVNTCGSSNNAAIKSLTSLPGKPGDISGSTLVNVKQAGLKYSVPDIAGITYAWTVPGKATITSGQNTNSITVTWGSTSGKISVAANNDCGASVSKSTLNVNLSSNFLSSSNREEAQQQNTTTKATVFPNPAKEIATLTFNSKKHISYDVQLFDVTGKMAVEKTGVAQTGTNHIALPVEHLSPGVYFIAFKDAENGSTTLKLVKE